LDPVNGAAATTNCRPLRPRPEFDESFESSVGTVDDYVGETAILRVDFIKVDTEGADYLVLIGAGSTICRDKPAHYVEIDDKQLAAFGATSGDVAEGMRIFVWRCPTHKYRAKRQLSPVSNAITFSGYENWLAFHRGRVSS
jgi:Methyltransferase FkbM domain